MPAFAVFIREETIDQSEMDTYGKSTAPTFEGREVTRHVGYGAFEVLEGPDIEGAVILEFPDMQAARDWYFSPAYQEVVQHRLKGAKYRGYILEGV